MGDSRPTETDSGIKGFITNADRVFQRRGAPSLSVRSEAVKPVTARPPGATPNQDVFYRGPEKAFGPRRGRNHLQEKGRSPFIKNTFSQAF